MCPESTGKLNQDSDLADGLAKLPQLHPERDAWPVIARGLQSPAVGGGSSARAWWLRSALAALLVLSLGAITLLGQRVDKQDQLLQAWIEYSQELESELNQLRGSNPAIRGHQAVAIGQLEDMVAVVDWQLASQRADEPRQLQRQLQLWQQRATLLNDLVTVRAGQRLLPAEQQQQPVITLNRPARLVSYEL